jgi:hypothetical protein
MSIKNEMKSYISNMCYGYKDPTASNDNFAAATCKSFLVTERIRYFRPNLKTDGILIIKKELQEVCDDRIPYIESV